MKINRFKAGWLFIPNYLTSPEARKLRETQATNFATSGTADRLRDSAVRGAFLLLLLAVPCVAQSARPLRVAEATFAAAAVADVRTAYGLYELNPVLGRGPFGARQAATSLAISGGVIVAAEALGRRYPKLRKPLAVTLFIAAGVRGGVAARNGGAR